jgi:hypothetical protein
VAVIHVDTNSTIVGPSGLKVGDVITSINGCDVKDSRNWHHCLAMADHVSGGQLQRIRKVGIYSNWIYARSKMSEQLQPSTTIFHPSEPGS